MLGKKYVLVSKYHVFHHATLPILIWVVANYMPGGQATFFALVNSFVHAIVLGYFVTVTAFPNLKQYTTWWKSAFNWLHVRLIASYRSCLMERNLFSDWPVYDCHHTCGAADILEHMRLSDASHLRDCHLRQLNFRRIHVFVALRIFRLHQ